MVLPEVPQKVNRIAYLGTPEIAVKPLRALHALGINVELVITGGDKRRGRGSSVTPTPVKAESIRLGIPVAHDLASLSETDVDLCVVVAFGKLIPEVYLKQIPMVNIHFSLLPRWRGAAPVERAILAGDKLTGVCVMRVEQGLDTGGLYRQKTYPIEAKKSLFDIRNELCDHGIELLVDCFENGFGLPMAQAGEVVYAEKIMPDECRIQWSQSAEQIQRVIQLGKAWTVLAGKRLHILNASIDEADVLQPGQMKGVFVGAGKGSIKLSVVKPEGRKEMPASDWINGLRIADQDRLG